MTNGLSVQILEMIKDAIAHYEEILCRIAFDLIQNTDITDQQIHSIKSEAAFMLINEIKEENKNEQRTD